MQHAPLVSYQRVSLHAVVPPPLPLLPLLLSCRGYNLLIKSQFR
jgi:hypothetical protein